MIRKEKKIEQKKKLLLNKFKKNKIEKSLFALSITLIILAILLFSPLANLTASTKSNNLSTGFVVNEQIHKEVFLDKDVMGDLSAGAFFKGTVVHINYTVLGCSNASVFFKRYYESRNYTIWSPVPENLILAPGESFAGDFTLTNSIIETGYSFYGYFATIEEGTMQQFIGGLRYL